MPRLHTVYVSKLGVPFIEEAQEFDSELKAVMEAADCFTPSPDKDGRNHVVPVIVKTHDGKYVALTGVDHINVLTPEELEQIKRQEAAHRGPAEY